MDIDRDGPPLNATRYGEYDSCVARTPEFNPITFTSARRIRRILSGHVHHATVNSWRRVKGVAFGCSWFVTMLPANRWRRHCALLGRTPSKAGRGNSKRKVKKGKIALALQLRFL